MPTFWSGGFWRIIRGLRPDVPHRVSAYGATYIALADLLGVSCVTEDRERLTKFLKRAVSVDVILSNR
jgi:hypothetical protein